TFSEAASAGQTAIVNNQTGTIAFSGKSAAANTTVTNNGNVVFSDESDAKAARLINNAEAGLTFQDRAGAGTSVIVSAGDLTFRNNSSADQSTILTSAGGITRFQDQADGGSATMQIDQMASLDVSQLTDQRLSLGSLTSAGYVILGNTVLSLHGNAVLNDTSKLSLVLGYGRLIASDVELQGGTLELKRAADLLYVIGETYSIIDALTFSGSSFSSDIIHDFAFLEPRLNGDGIAVTLNRNSVSFASVAETKNQHSVASVLDNLDQMTMVYRAVISGSKDDAFRGFDQLSGEVHATVVGAVHDNSGLLRRALLERARQATAADNTRRNSWESWLTATGSSHDHDGNENSAVSRVTGYAITGGFDRAISNEFSAGIAGAYEQNTLKISDRSSSADIKTVGGGIYAGWQYNGFGLRGGAAYQYHAIDTDRSIAFSALNGSLHSDYSASTGQIFAEAGYGFGAAGLQIEPYVGVSYVRSRFDTFQEYGLADAALTGSSLSVDSTLGTLGMRLSKRFALNNGFRVDAEFDAAWNRTFGQYNPVRWVSFASGIPFEVTSLSRDRDSAALSARLSFSRSDSFGIDAIYSGLLGEHTKGHRFGTRAIARF
ncbi:autotransporter domain-containing protein, partial [Paraburkholderia aspalathi]|nr:autotransporter domain-containing protein [Paraburkholderia aspalathi]